MAGTIFFFVARYWAQA